MFLLAPQRVLADEDDPPGRVARLNFTHGSVSFEPAGEDQWVEAVLNRPITTDDKLWTDQDSKAELHTGMAAIRLSQETGFSFLQLNDQITQVRLTEGAINIRLRGLDSDETFEVDTPNLAFSLLRPGVYRIDVNEAGDVTVISVRDGQGEVTGGGQAFSVRAGERGAFSGTEDLTADIEGLDGLDDFDHWCADRDKREDRATENRYVSHEVVGYEDLDDYGAWRPVSAYGVVWFPRGIAVGWAPYRFGHWVWIGPWGWTWVDDAPWGFAPFHYGRWVVVGGVWGWVPGPVVVRPVYAPALVAWVGGPHFGIGVSVGGFAAGVAWFPLGPREVYVPPYRVSRTYVTNVNVTNTTVNNTYVTNVYNNYASNKVLNVNYVNRTAVTATSQTAFTSAQPVSRNIVHVDQKQIANAPVGASPGVVPQSKSVLGAGATGPKVAQPPATIQARPVVAKTQPPPPPAPFSIQQKAIQANNGTPVPPSQMRQLRPTGTQNAAAVHPQVRMAPPVHPGAVQQGKQPGPVGGNPAQTGVPVHRQPPASETIRSDRPPSAQPSVHPSAPAAGGANQPGAGQGVQANRSDRPPRNELPSPQQLKYQQQQQALQQKQAQQQQQLQQRQNAERQRLLQSQANQRQIQQLEQKHQQQQQKLQQQHQVQQQKLQQKQQKEQARQQGHNK
jgi:hypothetical protein